MSEDALYNPFDVQVEDDTETPLDRALNNVMCTADGRAVVWALLEHAHIYDEPFHGNANDIYDKGRRSVGLWLLAQLNEIDPTMYPRMLLEVAKKERNET